MTRTRSAARKARLESRRLLEAQDLATSRQRRNISPKTVVFDALAAVSVTPKRMRHGDRSFLPQRAADSEAASEKLKFSGMIGDSVEVHIR